MIRPYHEDPGPPTSKGFDLHLRLTQAQYEWLQDIAKFHGLEMVMVVRAILADAIERSGRRKEDRLGLSVDRLLQRPFEAYGKPPDRSGS